ncbi:F0F1 ATP synthase subunit B [Garciella nitratireducens]|uniref:ATP synthase subunit b n=1 Tax=Garciella nitratireducens DSM 15102 TaxID=1121911 RepID=A0A1T4MKE0_9FIRM|nr:F0F1 ATP synthase subunit B [Garciella nitratireducens]SJZ67285.1 F-type H+-transporting ATPase subunit b [Garciella nitratireducens DSM 15102]
MSGEVGLVSIRWWELIAQIFNTVILFLALRHFLFKPVNNLMQRRKDEISQNLKDAEKAKLEANELKAIYQQKIDAAQEESHQIVKEAVRKGENRREEILQQAQEESKRMIKNAQLEISREKEKAMEELKDDIIEISLAAASMIIQKKLDQESHEKLIEQYIEEMGDVHV